MKVRRRKKTSHAHRIQKRQLTLEGLETRQLLAVDGFTIDLSGSSSGFDLFNPPPGSGIHDLFSGGKLNTGTGVTIGTSNVPGQNNERPVPGDDAANADEDGPTITLNVVDLLSNDVDPDKSATLSIVSVDASSSLGRATLDSGLGTITYDPSGAFESLANGQTTTDVFQYTLDDGANAQALGDVTVTVTGANDAPFVAGAATVSVLEGAVASHTGTFGDIDANSVVGLNASEGTVVDNGDGTWGWTLATTDDAVARDITITATDEHGVPSDFDFALTVENVAPTIDLTGNGTTDEAATFSLLLGDVTDPGPDTITNYRVDWGDGTIEDFADNTTPTKTHVYADGPNEFTITVSLTDEDGVHVAASHTVSVANVPPTVNANQATVTVDEGDTASNSGVYGDVGDDTVSVAADVGQLVDHNDGTWSWSLSTSDGPLDSQTVTVTATDSDGATRSTTFGLVVNNTDPAVAADHLTVTTNEGSTATNTGTYSDVAADNVALTASVGTVDDDGNGTWTWSFASTDGPDQSQKVTITATDKDGGHSTTVFDLVVNNLPPVAASQSISVFGNVPITRDWDTLLSSATDAGDDVLTLQSIDSVTDDGTLTVDSTAQTFRYVPETGFQGTTSFQFTIADSDGATHQETATITVGPALWVIDNSGSGGDGAMTSPF
ncbi:MAG: Ig-like domain-containing protein, partial [Planctomycetota bacterium]